MSFHIVKITLTLTLGPRNRSGSVFGLRISLISLSSVEMQSLILGPLHVVFLVDQVVTRLEIMRSFWSDHQVRPVKRIEFFIKNEKAYSSQALSTSSLLFIRHDCSHD